MQLWLLLILLGSITYYIVKRSASSITRTPIWLLWLVMMAPALVWSAWSLILGADQPLPTILVIIPFVICPILYWWLVEIGRLQPEITENQAQTTTVNHTTSESDSEQRQSLRPITSSEELALRDCFPWGIYYLQKIDYHPQAILCRGKLRTVPEVAYKTIKDNIEDIFGDRFLIVFQESLRGQPFFALVPNPWNQQKSKPETEALTRPSLAFALLLITLFTTTIVGIELTGITPEQFQVDPSLFKQGLPYSLALIVILGIHELSHYLTAIYYKIRVTLPYFIPVPFFLGTFGAFIQMRSPVPHRRALFDVAIAGPIGGFLVTLPLLIWGLSNSEVVQLPEKASLISFDTLNPRFSLLFSVLAKLALGSDLTKGMAIDLHPLAIAGYIGLIMTALNLMPVGQLDGGHIVHAMFGQRTAAIIGQITRFFMLVLAFIQPDFLIWAIILFLMPITDQPALNDVTELNNWRDCLGLLALAVLIIILLPLPGGLASLLQM